ncbi:MAG: TIGR03016 family PEP-CTERM system-associated outer membrane protein [Colwellia sp.]|nr:TIGR03016 family PEP-CTERM system-associated outer membrane protein [Colwellia sp.]
MAITAMVTVKNTDNYIYTKLGFLMSITLASSFAIAGDWDFKPNFGLTETYTDNVELAAFNHQSSVVSQIIAGLNTSYASREVEFSFSGTQTYAAYSHNSELNDDYQTAQFNSLFSLWRDGPKLIASSQISNVSQNGADNSLADLVSSDTVQSRSHSAGLQYLTANSHHNFSGSIIYSLTETEDSIGENKGYTANINSQNGNSARHVFWQISGLYSDRTNGNSTGTNYNLDAQMGAITTFKLNPFIRIYRENITGTAAGTSQNNSNSWGPGLRWQASDHLYIDVSYNYVEDKASSDDYIATNINWQPSQRTSLLAGYNQRFFGDSYNLNFSNKTKRLTNKISYDETVEVFDRDSFEEVTLGQIWCPVGGPFDVSSCFPLSQPPSDTSGYILVPIIGLTPVENNEFSLNKQLAWNSTLSLSRTTFTLDIATRKREGLSSDSLNDNFDISLSATRKLSPRSDLKFLVSYRETTYGTSSDTVVDAKQDDTYKTISATYNKSLASSLSGDFTIKYLDRESTQLGRSYDEIRASINITKDF